MNRQVLLGQLQDQFLFSRNPALDSNGSLIIGHGRNLNDRGISEDEAGFMLDNDIDQVEAELERMPLYLSLDPIRQVVMANMAFNMGMPTLLTFSRMLGAMAARDWDRAATEMLDSKWARQVGKRAVELSELMRRGEAPA
ncbi:glycoside hydrolase family protein [uncultured Marinobacter sp.]|uniref:glycoside hydrolase family protein n=1 Tax=uncultured Marinobacter sp. TaxID=187379 RepID=UPI0030D93BCB|tara:strand:- start:26259 stop:26678 length:420 start_codon:yes stop_codon:yes gene_type:complete